MNLKNEYIEIIYNESSVSLVDNGVTTNFFYDLNGNQTRKEKGIEKWYYTYDFENRLTKVEYFDGTQTTILGQYYYDGDGKRIKKVEASQTTIYIYLGWNIIYEKESSTMTETKHVFGPNGHVADIKGSTKYYYHSDHLGSLKQETDDSGNALWSSPAQYDPFGEMRSGGPEKDGYFYTGKLRDTSTGLYYYGARYYDAKIGRFITKDLWAGTIQMPQTLNDYIYVLNNPLKLVDLIGNTPSCPLCKPNEPFPGPGMTPEQALIGLLIAAGLTFIIAGVALGWFAAIWASLASAGTWVWEQIQTKWTEIVAFIIRNKNEAISFIRFQANTKSAQINDILNSAILEIKQNLIGAEYQVLEKFYGKFIEWVEREYSVALKIMADFVTEHNNEIPQWAAHAIEYVWEKITGGEGYRIKGAWIQDWRQLGPGSLGCFGWKYIED